ncbi:MAG: phosphoribosylglycinamide formyltransferase [Deltaproteobacteria bacterium]|nr:phosphoribosylglycinamide formyltransferase [Deltaproteobacteria bacterium]
MHKKIKLALLASGKGSNVRAIVEAAKDPQFPAYPGVIICDQKSAPVLAFAKEKEIPYVFLPGQHFATKLEYDQMLLTLLKQYQIDLIILAGFMRILSPLLIEIFPKRILNIHPSLLPKYPGLNAVGKALQAKDKESGCTVHYVDSGVDTGPVLEQVHVPILKEDTLETLHARIQVQEHLLYPKVIRKICEKLLAMPETKSKSMG